MEIILNFPLRMKWTLLLSDFNECSLNNAGCEHVCNNSAGSFNCDCRAGFKLKADMLGCEGKAVNGGYI